MNPSPQPVHTRRPARPRNVAVGCMSVLVAITFLLLVGWFVRANGPAEPRDAQTATEPSVTTPPPSP